MSDEERCKVCNRPRATGDMFTVWLDEGDDYLDERFCYDAPGVRFAPLFDDCQKHAVDWRGLFLQGQADLRKSRKNISELLCTEQELRAQLGEAKESASEESRRCPYLTRSAHKVTASELRWVLSNVLTGELPE